MAKSKKLFEKPKPKAKDVFGGRIRQVVNLGGSGPCVIVSDEQADGIEAEDSVIFHFDKVRYAGTISAVDTGAQGTVCLSLTDGLKPV